MKTPGLIVIILIVTAAVGCIGVAAADGTAQTPAKTQVLLYLVGSDLESESGTGTADLKEISQVYQNIDPSKLDIVVAFGGAKNPGWQGMKIATIEQLIQDAKDGTFGNGQYIYSDPAADMGKGQSLTTFLNTVKSSRPAEKAILILSNHGASYDGIGVDDNTKNSLMMGDLDASLRQAGVAYDPIMFDACLMSSVEVAKTIQPYTHIMLASEEIQRGSYEYVYLIRPLIDNPDTDSVTIAKTMVDAYIDQKEPVGKAKTMAVIDMSKIPALKDALNELGTELIAISETDQGMYDMKSAYNDAIRLGVSSGGKPTSVDLVSLLTNIEKKRPEVSPQVQKVIGLIKSAVIYERHNEYSQAVSGLSIATPDAMDITKYNQYGDGVKIAPQWDAFFVKVVTVSQGDTGGSSPTATTVAFSGASAATAEDRMTAPDKFMLSKPTFVSRGNGTFDLKDPYHAAEVYAAYYLVNGSDAISIGVQPISPDSSGLYHIPAWDGRWYYFPATLRPAAQPSPWDWLFALFAPPVKQPSARPLLVDMEYEGTTVGGHTVYTSWLDVTDASGTTDATLISYINQSTGTYEILIAPYTRTNAGNELFGIGNDRFTAGSVVTSYAPGFNIKTLKTDDYTLSSTTGSPDMQMVYTLLPDGTYVAGITAFYDDNAEVLADQFRIVTISGGTVTSSTLGRMSG